VRRERRARPWHALTQPNVPQPVLDSRLAECDDCPHFGPRSGLCGVCGCYMPIKARIPIAECPIGRWSKHDEAPAE
jgi:hypothetical protein